MVNPDSQVHRGWMVFQAFLASLGLLEIRVFLARLDQVAPLV
jgi:hypothetical protein